MLLGYGTILTPKATKLRSSDEAHIFSGDDSILMLKAAYAGRWASLVTYLGSRAMKVRACDKPTYPKLMYGIYDSLESEDYGDSNALLLTTTADTVWKVYWASD